MDSIPSAITFVRGFSFSTMRMVQARVPLCPKSRRPRSLQACAYQMSISGGVVVALKITWSTETLMRLQKQLLGGGEEIRFANAWMPIQSYYAIYNGVVAFNSLGSKISDNHSAHVHAINSYIIQAKWLPRCLRLSCKSPTNGKRAVYEGMVVDADRLVSNLIRSRELTYDVAQCLVAKSLKTTRLQQVDILRSNFLKNHKVRKLPGGQREKLESEINPTTFFDFLRRLRLRCNYQETETFVGGAWTYEDAETFSSSLVELTWHILSLLETLIAGRIGEKHMRSLVGEFESFKRIPGPSPAAHRWDPV